MTLSNKEIIEGLISHNKKIFEYVYLENYKKTVSYITKNYGNRHDAEDVFHDAFIAFYNILQDKKLNLTCSFTTFFISICKNIWFKEIERRSRTQSNIDQFNSVESSFFKNMKWDNAKFDEFDINDVVIQYEKDNLFRCHFEKLKDVCKKILLLYFSKTQMKDIAIATGYKSEQTVKVKKYYCQEELITNIKNDPEYLNIINKLKENS